MRDGASTTTVSYDASSLSYEPTWFIGFILWFAMIGQTVDSVCKSWHEPQVAKPP